jgi:ABC-2 type transport system permease protein
MAALMSSRRGRDLGMAVGIAGVVAYVGGSILLNAGRGGDPTTALTTAMRTARAVLWGPPGSWAVVPGALVDGDAVRLVVAALTAVAFLVVGWWWWSAALRRSLTSMPSSTAASSPARAGDLGSAVATSVTGTALLVATRDLRLAWRDPIRRLPWVLVVLFAVAWPFIVRGQAGIFAVVLGAIMAGAQTANHLGVEGSGIWLHLVAYADRVRARGEMLGHSLASVGLGAVIIAVALAVQVAARGHAELLPAAVGLCLCALLGAVGAACALSAALPYAMPQSRTSVFVSSIAGQEGRAAGATFAVLGIGAATAAPAVVAAVLAVTRDPAWGWLGVLAIPVCAVPVFVALAMLGARTYLQRGPEILTIVSVGDRS